MGNLQELPMHTGDNAVRDLDGQAYTDSVYAVGLSEPGAVATG